MKKKLFALILAAVMVLSIGTTSFAASGTWQYDGYGWWYAYDGGGYPVGTWEQIDGSWYYFDGYGYMATGWVWDGAAWYYMNSDGTMATGWIYDDYNWYFADPSGTMHVGWLNDGGLWYYMYPSGVMAVGWVWDGNDWYYMDYTGAMLTGWIFDNNNWYYTDPSGAMHIGWLLDGENWYYMVPSGAMLYDATLQMDGKDYVFDAYGRLISEADEGGQDSTPPQPQGQATVEFVTSDGTQSAQGTVEVRTEDIPAGTDEEMVSIMAPWINNNKFRISLIASFSGYPFTQDEIDEAIRMYPPMWKNQLDPSMIDSEPEDYIGGGFPISSSGRDGFNYNAYNKVYVLFLNMDENFNYLAHTIATITK